MLRRRVHALLEVSVPGDRAGRLVDIGLVLLIVANVVALLLESTVDDDHVPFFDAFELVSVAVFTIEYVLRLWSAPESPRYAGGLRGRARWAATPLAIVDLLAIAPTWIAMIAPVSLDLRVLRALRLLRIARLGKLGRYSASLMAIGRALRARASELGSVVFVLLIVLTIAATLMFHVERDANPGAFPSIPAAMWWGIATLTTVGYGDAVPVTALGKLLGAAIAVLGIGLFALPAAILSGSFTEELRKRDAGERAATCPHCGEELPPHRP